MDHFCGLRRSLLISTVVALGAISFAAQAVVGVREAAVSLERQLQSGKGTSVTQAVRLPLLGSSVVLGGAVTLEAIDASHCRRTLELVYDQAFERNGLRITNLSRRSVQMGPCHDFAEALTLQANASAQSIAEQIGVTNADIDPTPAVRVQLAASGAAPLREATRSAVVALTVLERAFIRDAPNREGEKLSRADQGTQLKASRIAGNPDWFVLDGGLRFISASVVDVSDAATVAAPARGDTSRVRLKVMERAVLRNAPSFKGKKMASLAAGVERLARKVPGFTGWFELADSHSSTPLYIHESVVAEKLSKPSDKRL